MKISLKFKRSATIFIALTSLIFTVVGTQSVLAQECVSCDSTTTGGLFPSAIADIPPPLGTIPLPEVSIQRQKDLHPLPLATG